MRFLLRASLSLNGFSEYSGQTADMKAICLPSRDQVPTDASELMVVSWRASPPARSMIQSWVEPPRLDSKRIDLPSGLQRGWRSALGPAVSCFGLPSLSVEASQRLVT